MEEKLQKLQKLALFDKFSLAFFLVGVGIAKLRLLKRIDPSFEFPDVTDDLFIVCGKNNHPSIQGNNNSFQFKILESNASFFNNHRMLFFLKESYDQSDIGRYKIAFGFSTALFLLSTDSNQELSCEVCFLEVDFIRRELSMNL